jgi:hypothetical protein
MNMTLYVGMFMIIFDNYNLDATVIERNTLTAVNVHISVKKLI